jgi:hypothetical protein
LARSAIALGHDAIRKTAGILAVTETVKATLVGLVSGTQWGGDRVLLSIEDGCVQFVAGNTLYKQDQADFLRAEFPAGSAFAGRASWLQGISPQEMPFCMGLAAELPPAWPVTACSTCAFLERFGHFYRSHRPQIELAGRESRYVVEGLLALQHWPALLEAVMDSMGEPARRSFPKGLADADLGAFIGRLLLGPSHDRIRLAPVPDAMRTLYEQDPPAAEVYLRIPQYLRTLKKLENHAESLAPLIEELRAAL